MPAAQKIISSMATSQTPGEKGQQQSSKLKSSDSVEESHLLTHLVSAGDGHLLVYNVDSSGTGEVSVKCVCRLTVNDSKPTVQCE